MLFSKEYVGYLAREVSKKLVASGLIETKAMPALNEKVHSALLEELALEDRINDEVRVILEAYSDEMQKSGANYQEMFRKVKTELAKKSKASASPLLKAPRSGRSSIASITTKKSRSWVCK